MSDDKRFQEVLSQCADLAGRVAERHFLMWAPPFVESLRTGSPIEKLLAAALVLLWKTGQDHDRKEWLFSNEPGLNFKDLVGGEYKHGVNVFHQVTVGSYRADFLIRYQHEGVAVWGVIECDGHDFHEKTKEQAQRDKARDRDMQAAGLLVLRYTGSEIWADPLLVAMGAVEILKKRAEGQI